MNVVVDDGCDFSCKYTIEIGIGFANGRSSSGGVVIACCVELGDGASSGPGAMANKYGDGRIARNWS